MVKQETTTQGIKMSKRVGPILITRWETIILPRVEPTMAQGVLVAVKVRYNEPRFNLQNRNIVKGISRD
jgi:hypothetical protein